MAEIYSIPCVFSATLFIVEIGFPFRTNSVAAEYSVPRGIFRLVENGLKVLACYVVTVFPEAILNRYRTTNILKQIVISTIAILASNFNSLETL